jgi:hypothetical protein
MNDSIIACCCIMIFICGLNLGVSCTIAYYDDKQAQADHAAIQSMQHCKGVR